MSARQNRRHREEITVISWRNIPAQVVATSSGGKQTAVLSDRFQDAIDRAAAVAGLTDDDAYVGEWSRQAFPLPEEATGFPRDRYCSREAAARLPSITSGCLALPTQAFP